MPPKYRGAVWAEVSVHPTPRSDERGNRHGATISVLAEGLADDGLAARRDHEIWWKDIGGRTVYELRGQLTYYTEDSARKLLGLLEPDQSVGLSGADRARLR